MRLQSNSMSFESRLDFEDGGKHMQIFMMRMPYGYFR